MFSKIALRSPLSATGSSVPLTTMGMTCGAPMAGAVVRACCCACGAARNACQSCVVTRPLGPLAGTVLISMPFSRACQRIAGAASVCARSGAEPTGAWGAAAPAAGTGEASALGAFLSLDAPENSEGRSKSVFSSSAGLAAGAAAGGAEAASPPTLIVMMTSPTLTVWPSLAFSSAMVPVLGLLIMTVALSVMTSTMSWSSFTAWPGFTCHWTISPSCTPSAMSGSLNWKTMAIGLLSARSGRGSLNSSLAEALARAREGRGLLPFPLDERGEHGHHGFFAREERDVLAARRARVVGNEVGDERASDHVVDEAAPQEGVVAHAVEDARLGAFVELADLVERRAPPAQHLERAAIVRDGFGLEGEEAREVVLD